MRSKKRKGGRGLLTVRRLPVIFTHDIRRVITRFFDPGGETRIRNIVERVGGLSDEQVDHLLENVFLKFRTRHGNIVPTLDENYRTAMSMLGMSDDFAGNRRLLIGAYLTAEYSIESAALFNPSIVPHHNQRNLPAGAVRFIMSLRATGEGHVSSIVFRSGVITADHQVQIDPCALRPADSRRARQAVRKAALPAEAGRHRRARGGDDPSARSPARLFYVSPTRTRHHRGAGGVAGEAYDRGVAAGHPLAGPIELSVGASARGRGVGSGHLSANQQ